MAETRKTDVIIPEVFNAYTVEMPIARSRFWRAGIIQDNPAIVGNLNGGGGTFNLPFWKNITDDTGDAQIPDEASDSTITNTTSGKQIAGRFLNVQNWGSNDLAAVLAGEDPMTSIIANVNNYWDQWYDKVSIAITQGVIAANIAGAGDLINDQAASAFSDDLVIDTQALLGENGILGRGDNSNGEWAGICMHPLLYASARKKNLITFIPISDQPRPLPFYMNMEVIVDKNLPLNGAIHDTIIYKTGAMNFGSGTAGFLPTETDRAPAAGFGIDQLFTRRNYTIHPVGWQFLNASVAGESPTLAEFKLAANWAQSFKTENAGFVVLRSLV